MKKYFRLFLFASIIFCIIVLSGCQLTLDNFVDGQYISINEVNNEMFSKIKLELHQIDEEKYFSSNDVNVIRDVSITEYNKYFSFELYVYLSKSDEYVKINLTNFFPDAGTPQIYYAYPIEDQENYNIESITFMYNHKKIMISQNGTDYYYEIIKK